MNCARLHPLSVVLCLGCGDEISKTEVVPEQIQQVELKNDDAINKTASKEEGATDRKRYSFACTRDNLSGSHKGLLRFYRNEIFARLGRGFKSKDLQELFGQMSWYKVSSSYADELLTDEDKKCLELIQSLEQAQSSSYPLYPSGPIASPDLDGDGVGEQISYDGLNLTVGKSEVSINKDVPMYFKEEGLSGAIALLDLDMTDASRELLVVTDPGVTDELQFQLFGYKNKAIVPLMSKAEWVQMGSFNHLVGSLQQVYDNCGAENTLQWKLGKEGVSKTKTTRKTDSVCAACPYVYTLTQRLQRFSGEILKNQYSRDLYREDLLKLGHFEEDENLRVRLVELKAETTFLDSISIVVSDEEHGSYEELPEACNQEQYGYCATDKLFTTIDQGEALELSFKVPVQGAVWLKATGYYLPDEAD